MNITDPESEDFDVAGALLGCVLCFWDQGQIEGDDLDKFVIAFRDKDPDGPSLDEYLLPITEMLAPSRLKHWRLAERKKFLG